MAFIFAISRFLEPGRDAPADRIEVLVEDGLVKEASA